MKNGLNPYMIFIILLSSVVGCSTMNKIPLYSDNKIVDAPTVIAPKGIMRDAEGRAVIPVRTVIKHDTIPARKTTNQAQVQAFLDGYFNPRFNQMNDVIKKQAGSIQTLTDILVNIRMRSIKRVDSMNAITLVYQKQIQKLQEDQLDKTILQIKSNNAQVSSSNRLIKYLTISVTILFFGMVGLYLSNRVLFQKIKQLQKSLNYA